MSTPQYTLFDLIVVQLPFSLLRLFSKLRYLHFVNNVLQCSLCIIDLPIATIHSFYLPSTLFVCIFTARTVVNNDTYIRTLVISDNPSITAILYCLFDDD